MSTKYTPPTDVVRATYSVAWDSVTDPADIKEVRNQATAEFERWLETVRAEAKAEALEEAAAKLEDASVSPILCWDKCGDPKCRDDIRVGAATEIQSWLRARANQYKTDHG